VPVRLGVLRDRAPLRRPGEDSRSALAGVAREWDWVLDDFRRHQPIQLETFAGMRD
jgi:hypothetical protein